MNVARLEAASRSAAAGPLPAAGAARRRPNATAACASAASAACRCSLAEPFKNLLNARLVHEPRGSCAAATRASTPPVRRAATHRAGRAGDEGPRDADRRRAGGHAAGATSTDAADTIEAALAPAEAKATRWRSSTACRPACAAGSCGRWASSSPAAAWPSPSARCRRCTRSRSASRPSSRSGPSSCSTRRWCSRHWQRWTTDPSAHVRRLVSEGSRPRLPWGLQLQALVPTRRPRCRCCGAAGRPQRVRAPQRGQPPQRHRQGPPGLVADWLARAPARRQRRAPRAAAPRQPHAGQGRRRGGAGRLGPGRGRSAARRRWRWRPRALAWARR
jgi:hypothetical protein